MRCDLNLSAASLRIAVVVVAVVRALIKVRAFIRTTPRKVGHKKCCIFKLRASAPLALSRGLPFGYSILAVDLLLLCCGNNGMASMLAVKEAARTVMQNPPAATLATRRG